MLTLTPTATPRPSFMRTVVALVRWGYMRVQTIGVAMKHRRDAAMLVELDDRMLRDMGLNRSDLRDAISEPVWRDPTAILATRAAERRRNRPLTSPPLVPGFDSDLKLRAQRFARYY